MCERLRWKRWTWWRWLEEKVLRLARKGAQGEMGGEGVEGGETKSFLKVSQEVPINVTHVHIQVYLSNIHVYNMYR